MEFQEEVTLMGGRQRIIKKETASKITLVLYMHGPYALCRTHRINLLCLDHECCRLMN